MTRSTYFRLYNKENYSILSDRMEFRWKEVIIFPIPFFVLLFFVGGWLTALIVTIIVTVFYILFRFAAWYYFSEIVLDTTNGILTLRKYLFSKVNRTVVLTKKYDPKKLIFKEILNAGKTKYILCYQDYKETELLIVKNEKDKDYLESELSKNNWLQHAVISNAATIALKTEKI